MSTTPAPARFQRVDYAIYGALAGLKMWMHVAATRHDGMFRDEFYYLACASRLDWGYVDQPPLSIVILALWRALFGDSLLAIRMPAILAVGAIVVLLGMMTRRMGGGRFAQGFTMFCFLICPMMLGIHSYFSMNAFDHLFWVLAAYLFVRLLETGNAHYWLWFGLVCGLGLQNKLSMLFFGMGVVTALAFTPQRKWFLSPWLYAGGAVALLLFLPNLLWQSSHGYATLEFMSNAALYKNSYMPPWSFLLALVLEYHPLLAPLWVMGALYPFVKPDAQQWRPMAIIFLAVLIFFTFSSGKTYYVAPAFLMVLPLAAIWFEQLTDGTKTWRPGIAYVLFTGGLITAPVALPFLPYKDYVNYAAAIGLAPAAAEKGQSGPMPQHVADRLGWKGRAELVKKAFDSLSPEDQAKCVIYGPDYGEAAAMEYYAEELGLPRSVSGHNNFWLWGPGDATGEVVIVIAEPDSGVLPLFESIQDMGVVETKDAKFQMQSWQDKHVYIARGLKISIATLWPELRHYI